MSYLGEFLKLQRLLKSFSGFQLIIVESNSIEYYAGFLRELEKSHSVLDGRNRSWISEDNLVPALASGTHDLALIPFSPEEGLVTSLNQSRESLAVAHPKPLILFLGLGELSTFADLAPDLWAWRAGVFDFVVKRPAPESSYLKFPRRFFARLIDLSFPSAPYLERKFPRNRKREQALLYCMLGRYGEGKTELEAVNERDERIHELRLADRPPTVEVSRFDYAITLLALGVLHRQEGSLTDSLQYLARAASLFSEQSSTEVYLWIKLYQATLARQQGFVERADAMLAEILAASDALEDSSLIVATAKSELVNVKWLRGEYPVCQELVEDGLYWAASEPDWGHRTQFVIQAHMLDKNQTAFTEPIFCNEKLDPQVRYALRSNPEWEAVVGRLACLDGQLSKSREVFQAIRNSYAQYNEILVAIQAWWKDLVDKPTEELQKLNECETKCRLLQYSVSLSKVLRLKSYVFWQLERYQDALATIEEGRELSVELCRPLDVDTADLLRAFVLSEAGQLEAARGVCLKLLEPERDVRGLVKNSSSVIWGRVEGLLGDKDKAQKLFSIARSRCRSVTLETVSYLYEAQIYCALEKSDLAEESRSKALKLQHLFSLPLDSLNPIFPFVSKWSSWL